MAIGIFRPQQVEETARFLRHLNQELGLSVGLFLCLLGFRVTTGAISLFYYLRLYIHPEVSLFIISLFFIYLDFEFTFNDLREVQEHSELKRLYN